MSCCPSYTIRLDCLEFKPSKSKRKLVNRFNRFIVHGKSKPLPPAKTQEQPFALETAIHAAEAVFYNGPGALAHTFEVFLEPSSFSDEKFALYCRYQQVIHSDSDNTPSSFRRFLVNSPLRAEPIPYMSPQPAHLPANYGSYHQLYKCDGKLIAVGVLDILPGCVSSVYFFYDPDWEEYSMGKLSALREATLATEINKAGVPDMGFLYMGASPSRYISSFDDVAGFYIHSCPKMRYKGDYSPSYLADPETFEWFSLDATCIKLLEGNRYACFSHPERSTSQNPEDLEDETPQLALDTLTHVNAVDKIAGNVVQVVPVMAHPAWKDEEQRGDIIACISGLGPEVAEDVILLWRVVYWVPIPLLLTNCYTVKQINGRSMQPTLNPDESLLWRDVAFFDRVCLLYRPVRRGDIVSLISPMDPKLELVKRVVALEGDVVQTLPPHPESQVVVPKGSIWVEGDAFHSQDSNTFGPVPTGFKQADQGLHDDIYPADDTEPALESVLDAYEHAAPDNALLKKIFARPDAEHLVDVLLRLLEQPPTNDISGDVAEVVGYEDMDLVMEILASRGTLSKQLGDRRNTRKDEATDFSSLSADDARRRMEETFRHNAARPLFSHTAEPEPEVLPHIYTSSSIVQGNVLSQFGSRYMLPLGTTREMHEDHEEVVIPPARPVPTRTSERLIPVSELDPLARGSFPGYATLNRIQSIVYPTAYGSNENMLVCAPTGAGKTDVAMLTILRVLDQHRTPASNSTPIAATINKNAFKIIYVAPMKALASEIVRKFSKRLQWLNVQVRELTGDMQLTKNEIAQTQVIVTTPEKWDVVTRKPTGEGELASTLRLLIIDEVHLLNEERGAVIETIVARTLRQVESSQSVIRIVGLSATLPNYMDVAEFLSVSRYKGLFYFDSSFRPVPLEQHFIGIKGKPGSQLSKKNLDRVTFQKVSALVAEGHQVMVFVHARKETVKTALALKEASLLDGNMDDFSCEEHPQWSQFRRNISESRNREMKQLFDSGFGIHHAGMLRSDRNMMERMFEARAIKVLCCTATLAWGVNLPAHAVVIKGTQVYDSAKGAFVDLSVLDVLQVFGRAGRPGLETSGEGYICTTDDKLTHYLEAVTSQVNPIESQFRNGMFDSLNAEISLGTVANIRDGVRWLGYTYLFVRMRKNPFVYGISRDVDDPQLGSQRNDLMRLAAAKLANAKMIDFDLESGELRITDLGRIASKYYIRHTSMEIFNKEFRPKMSEADVLGMLSMSTEFDQIQVRESEAEELKAIMQIVPCDVKGGPDTSQGKVNILLQGYISRLTVEDFALVSDMAYAAQNGGRIVRALLEIAISRKWANVAAVLMGMSKAIEKRLWPFDQPLKQFDLKADVFYHLERWADEWAPADLATLSADDAGKLIHLNEIHGRALVNAAQQFPSVRITYRLRPLGFDVLKLAVKIEPTFTWSKVHGSSEPFWLWVEDHDSLNILQLSHLVFRSTTDALDVDLLISIPEGHPPPFVTIRYVSDRWMAAEDQVSVPLDGLIMPSQSHSHSPRLDLPFLSTSVLRNQAVHNALSGRVHNLNSIQTQSFWTLANTQSHSLLCAPGGSGKSVMMRIVAWLAALKAAESWILVIAPTKSAAADILTEFRVASVPGIVVESTESISRPQARVIRIITARNLLQAMSQRDPKLPLRGLDLVVCENLEQLDPAYELGVSLLRHACQSCPTRFIGGCNSLRDPADLANWLNVDEAALLSFRPMDRDQSLAISTQTFTIPHSASLFKAMAKPAYTAIRSAGGQSAIVFVPSRSQCKPVAYDLITQCALEQESDSGFLPDGVSSDRLEDYLARLRDPSLVDVVSRGIGFFHEGIHRTDREIMLELYAEGLVRVVVVPRESCWTLPVRAGVVVVMGTQFVHVPSEGGDRQVRDYGLVEMVRMQSRAVRHAGAGHFHLLCQKEAKDTFMRFLSDGLPLESSLLASPELQSWYQTHADLDKQQLVDALSFTFLVRRITTNPTYYDCAVASRDENISRVVDDLVYNLKPST
ncbi:hypothetical protein MKEN_00094100 [Mycena kentingensis (nom. inval.)]|nr:hypothetical protein MKEN_00094100 [Mycena kentingensis (nom. inval.)]